MLHGHRKVVLIFIVIFIIIPCSGEAGDFSLGIGWPYASLKYTVYKSLDFEARYAAGDRINVYAGRFYWNFHNSEKLKGFAGIEGGGIKFDTLDIKGNGYEGSVFIGGEYFVLKRVSIAVDFAPTYIGLKSDASSDNTTVNGIEWVGNIALYYYFFRE